MHDDDGGSLFNSRNLSADGEYRVRAAIRSAEKRAAEQVSNEVLSLFCCGPAAGGGVRQMLTPQVSTASILIDRDKIEKRVRAVEIMA